MFFPLQFPLNIEVGASTSEDFVFTPNVIGLYDEDISIRNNSTYEQQIINVLADVFSPNYLRIVDQDVQRDQTSTVSLNLVNNDLVSSISSIWCKRQAASRAFKFRSFTADYSTKCWSYGSAY